MGVLLCALSGSGGADTLTLDEALAAATAPHPDWRIAEAERDAARADLEQAGSRKDFSVFVDGALRQGRRPDGEWNSDDLARIVARKPLLDFGRSTGAIDAAGQELAAREASLVSVGNLRRLDIMARYFDVLLADLRYTVDNEFMAATYVTWDNARDRMELGQISRPELSKLEADYQDIRERRNASLQRMRSTRQALAHAINRPQTLTAELQEPELPGNDRPLPEYQTLLAWVQEKNPRVRALTARIAAADARLLSLRAERSPVLDAEVSGATYSRQLATRDEISAGLVFSVPLYQGGRVDAREARERAAREHLLAEREKLRFDLADLLLATLQEIEWLRGSARPAADKQIEYRDWALERARAEYELEMRTTLGTSMAETQAALFRRRQTEYRLTLALARLEALAGGSLPPAEGTKE